MATKVSSTFEFSEPNCIPCKESRDFELSTHDLWANGFVCLFVFDCSFWRDGISDEKVRFANLPVFSSSFQS